MKRLEISFFDTDEKVIVDENALVIALDNKTTPDGMTRCIILEADGNLPKNYWNVP